MEQSIVCPSCKTIIDLDKLSQDKYRKKLEEEFEKEREEMRKKAIDFAKSEALKQAKKDSIEMQDLKNRLAEEQKQIENLQKQELEMRKKQRELEQKEKDRELEMTRKLDEQKRQMQDQITKELNEKNDKQLEERLKNIQEENRKKELEYQKQQEQMKKTIDDLKRKSEQWSQQIQGDISEEDLKTSLKLNFPFDLIEDVPTWVKWADIIQKVRDKFWQDSWTIVWESKNTKAWSDSWIMKLKEDKLKVNWDIAILVSYVMPKDIKNFGLLDDVMVCSPEFVIAVSSILRDKLLSVSKIEKSVEWKDLKMEMLYKYLTSEEFSSKISMIVDVFSNLKAWIDAERRAMEKNWKKRERDLERASFAVTHMYWDLESLMWKALPGAEKLELASGEEDGEVIF